MPVDPSQRVNSPTVGTDINADWGQGVAESVLQRFLSAADRDQRWTNPPNNAMCFHDGIPWIYSSTQGRWRPAMVQQFSHAFTYPGAVNGSGLDIQVSQIWSLMPKAAYDAYYTCYAEGYGGYSGQAGNFGYAIFDNSVASPVGGGWYQPTHGRAGRGFQPANAATWAQLGTAMMSAYVAKGQKPGTIVRLGWSGGANMWLSLRMTWTLIPINVAPFRANVFTMGTHPNDHLDQHFQLGGV